jgi:hypothetical protein
VNRFKEAYAEALEVAVEQFPDEYPWAREDTVIVGNLGNTTLKRKSVEDVTAGMFAAMDRGSYNKDGRAFKAACKALGISHTYKAINAVLAE